MKDFSISYDNFGAIFKVNENHFEEFCSLLNQKIIRKGDYFLQFGKTCKDLGFVLEGTLRSFYIDEQGVDKSFNFHSTFQFFTNYDSFLRERPSLLYIQALEDTQVLLLSKQNLTTLFKKDIYWLEFRRDMSEKMYLESQQRIEELLYYSPEKRYLKLLETNPDIFQHVQQKYIASFLGITPQSLSRIKNRITKS